MHQSAKHYLQAPGRAEQLSTRLVFLIAGLGMSAWAPLVPFAKARVGADEGQMGLLLLCLGAGSIVSMPLSGAMTARFGCRKVILVATILSAIALPLLATVSSLPLLVGALLLFGAAIGALDVSINVQAIIVERASGKSMMSGFHGLFSLGGMVGASGLTLLLYAGMTPLAGVLVLLMVLALCLAISMPAALPYGSQGDGPPFAIPHGIVLWLGLICFIVFMMEGSVLDWSAIFLNSVHGLPKERAGLGYAAFAVTMTLGRLTGDWIVPRIGTARVVLLGGLIAGVGVFVATFGGSWLWGVLGYALVGVGCSNIAPVMFTAAGRQTQMPENVAVPAISTLGYAGVLAGPALIGFVSHASSLQVAFYLMAALLVTAALGSRFLKL